VVDRQMRSTMRKHELINVLISDPGDFHLPSGGIVTVRNLENGGWITLDAFDEKSRNAYEIRQRKAYRSILDQMKGSSADCIEISTDGSAADALTRYFRRRERRKR
jgi:hypothetical protein